MKTPPDDSVIINVCIIPPQGVGDVCVAMSQSIKSDATIFALDGKEKFAHMTVDMVRVDRSKVSDVVATVKGVIKSASPFACDHTGYFRTQGRYLEVSYHRSDDFMKLHEAILVAVAPLRLNPGNPFEEAYFTPYTAEQQQNTQETGYDLARRLYRPHITLTRFLDGHVPEIFPAFPPAKLSFVLSTVCVYEADDNGAVNKELARFSI